MLPRRVSHYQRVRHRSKRRHMDHRAEQGSLWLIRLLYGFWIARTSVGAICNKRLSIIVGEELPPDGVARRCQTKHSCDLTVIWWRENNKRQRSSLGTHRLWVVGRKVDDVVVGTVNRRQRSSRCGLVWLLDCLGEDAVRAVPVAPIL